MVYTLKHLAAFLFDEFSAHSQASNFNLIEYNFLLRVSSDIFSLLIVVALARL